MEDHSSADVAVNNASVTIAAVAAAEAAVATYDGEVFPERYLGVVKSYNDRRGFGFVACDETAALFGRDVCVPR
jgi:hypothetical protein